MYIFRFGVAESRAGREFYSVRCAPWTRKRQWVEDKSGGGAQSEARTGYMLIPASGHHATLNGPAETPLLSSYTATSPHLLCFSIFCASSLAIPPASFPSFVELHTLHIRVIFAHIQVRYFSWCFKFVMMNFFLQVFFSSTKSRKTLRKEEQGRVSIKRCICRVHFS